MMTAVMTEIDTDAPGTCWECGGPCLTFKGTEHGWRCRGCIDRYLDAAAAKAEAREKARQAKKVRAAWNYDSTSVTAEDRRRDGGGLRYVPPPARRRPTVMTSRHHY